MHGLINAPKYFKQDQFINNNNNNFIKTIIQLSYLSYCISTVHDKKFLLPDKLEEVVKNI